MGCQQSRLSDPVLVQNPSFGLSPKSTSPLHAGAAGSRVLPPEAPSPLCATAEELSKKPPLPAAPPSPALSRQSPSTAVVSSPLLAAPVALQHVASELTATHDPGVPAAADARPRLVSSALCDESLVARSKSEAVQPVSAAALSPESALPPPPAAAAPPVVPAIPLPLPAVAASPPVPVVSAVPSQGGAASASVTTRAVPPRSAAPPLPRLPTSEGPFVSPRGGRDVIEVTSERKIKDAATGEKRVNQYLMREVLGRGAYGKVRRCVDEQTGAVRAVKIIRKSVLKRKRVGRFGNALQTVLREIAIWKKLDHPNVVTLFEGETLRARERARQWLLAPPRLSRSH